MMEMLARFYVNSLEPAMKVGAFLVMAYLILQAWILLRDGKKLGDVLSAAIMLLVKAFVNTLKFVGKSIVFVGVVLQKTLRETAKAIADFFNSPI